MSFNKINREIYYIGMYVCSVATTYPPSWWPPHKKTFLELTVRTLSPLETWNSKVEKKDLFI